MIHKPGAYAHKREHEVHAEQMPLDELLAPMRHARTPHAPNVNIGTPAKQIEGQTESERGVPGQVQAVVRYDGERYYYRLAYFRTVDPSNDIAAQLCIDRKR